MRNIFVAFFVSTALAAAESNGGKVVWPEDYVLEIGRPISQLADAKPYLAGVVQNLIADELFLQRSALTRGEVSPVSIEYPVRENHENLPADERETLLASYPKPQILPLRLVRKAQPPAAFACAGEKKDRYALLTQISGRSHRLKMEILLCQGTKALLSQSATADEQELVAAVARLVNPVRARLTGDAYASLHIESAPARASVYLDDQFLGKTPLKYSYLIPGTYRLAVRRDGFESFSTTVHAAAGTTVTQQATLSEASARGVISVVSDPPGARIYLDADYKGMTPKTLERIPNGRYRLHLLHPEKGEVYRTVTITDDKPALEISETLSEFADQRIPGLLGVRYKTWYWITLASSAVCFGSAIGFYVWRGQAQEDLFERLSGKSTASYTQEDYAFIADRNAAYDTRESFATGFMIGAGSFAVLSIYFYVQHLLSADEGIVLRQAPKQAGDVEIRMLGWQSSGPVTGIAADFRF